MPGITYSEQSIECFHCHYLLTVVNSNPDSGESKITIYCQLKNCPIINKELLINNQSEQEPVEKIEKCMEVLRKCIKNISVD